MKNFIIWLFIAVIFFGSIIYFVFSSDKSLTITYVKFNINPEFIIGVNSSDEVKIYNPLNDDAKVLNLSMFNGYKIEDAVEVILNKLDSNNFLAVSQIDITVITKNSEKIDYYYNKINSVIKDKKQDIALINNKATRDELLAYSNEVAYDLKPSFTNDTLLPITNELNDSIAKYIDQKLLGLKLNNLSIEDKRIIIDAILTNGYFDDYSLSNYKFNSNDFIIDEKSNYEVEFRYDENEINYDINLDLVLEYKSKLEKKDITYHVIEEYKFKFIDGEIRNLETNFYKFN